MPTVDNCVSNIFRDLNFSNTVVSTVVRSYALGITGRPVLGALAAEVYAGFTVYGTGGVRPFGYSLQGSWPTGISIDNATGVVSGTPTVVGTYTGLSVRVTDSYGVTADLPTFTLTVYNDLRLDFSHDYNSQYIGAF